LTGRIAGISDILQGVSAQGCELRASGFSTPRLEDGYPECRAAGLPVEAQRD
jgi:hypothetical protein